MEYSDNKMKCSCGQEVLRRTYLPQEGQGFAKPVAFIHVETEQEIENCQKCGKIFTPGSP
jgi:hypothetical protein